MKKIALLFTFVLVACWGYDNKITIESPLIVYKGIALGCHTSIADSVIKNDTTCYSIKRTSFCYGPEYDYHSGKYLLGHYKEESYRGNLIIPTITPKDTTYNNLDGWFSYQQHNDTIFSITCIFNFYDFNDNSLNKEKLSSIKYSIIDMYCSKYGKEKKIDNKIWLYNFNHIYYDFKTQMPFLNITEAFSWIHGQYEIQFFINKVNSNRYSGLYNDFQEYEIIIRYLDNKLIKNNKDDYYNKRKEYENIKLQLEKNKIKEEQIELKNKHQNQTF